MGRRKYRDELDFGIFTEIRNLALRIIFAIIACIVLWFTMNWAFANFVAVLQKNHGSQSRASAPER